MFDRMFRALGRFLARGFVYSLIFWVVLVAVCAWPAYKLNDHLGDNTVTLKGTDWYKANDLIKQAFPDNGASDVVVALEAPNVLAKDAQQFYRDLETYLKGLKEQGVVLRYATPLELYRTSLSAYLEGAHDQLWPAYTEVRKAAQDMGKLRDQMKAATQGSLSPAAVEAIARQQLLAMTPAPQRNQALAIFDLGPAPSDEKLMDYVIAEARKQATETTDAQAALWKQALQLGEQPVKTAYETTAVAALPTLDLAHFPVELPDAIVHQLVSKDATLSLTSVTFATDNKENTYRVRREIKPFVPAGEKAYLTGTGPLYVDLYDAAQSQTELMDIGAVAAIVFILSIFFRSPLPMLLTLFQVGLALVVGRGALWMLATQFGVYLSPSTMTLMSFVMLGAGVDYSMILSERYQQERRQGRSKEDAVAVSAQHAGESVFFSGATVLVSFGALTTSNLEWLAAMGVGGIVAVISVLLAALTMTPALLMLLGDKFFWPAKPRTEEQLQNTPFQRYLKSSINFTLRRPVVVALIFLLPTVPAIFGVLHYNPESSPVALSGETDSKQGFERMNDKFGAGHLITTDVALTVPEAWFKDGKLSTLGEDKVRSLHIALAGSPGVARIRDVVAPFGEVLRAEARGQLPADIEKSLMAPTAHVLKLQVEMAHDPFTAAGKQDLQAIKDSLGQLLKGQDVTFGVTGGAEFDRTYKAAIFNDFYRLVPTIAIGIFILLALLLRSIITPLRLVVTILMGNLWAVAVLVWVFQDIRHVSITADVPLFLMVLMMGLGMDYEIFLVTRVREHVLAGHDDATAVRSAVLQTGRVINGAGLVMATTLMSLLMSPALILQSYGLALGFAVLVDATIMRMYLVPATMLLLKRANWWFPFMKRPVQRAEGHALDETAAAAELPAQPEAD